MLKTLAAVKSFSLALSIQHNQTTANLKVSKGLSLWEALKIWF